MAVKDVKALFLVEKWPKFSCVIKVQNSAVTDKENPRKCICELLRIRHDYSACMVMGHVRKLAWRSKM